MEKCKDCGELLGIDKYKNSKGEYVGDCCIDKYIDNGGPTYGLMNQG